MRQFDVEFTTAVRVTINDPDVIDRVTGPNGDEWRKGLYDLRTEEDVLEHLAYNCLVNGQTNARLLDGWADLPESAVAMEHPEPRYFVLAVIPVADSEQKGGGDGE